MAMRLEAAVCERPVLVVPVLVVRVSIPNWVKVGMVLSLNPRFGVLISKKANISVAIHCPF